MVGLRSSEATGFPVKPSVKSFSMALTGGVGTLMAGSSLPDFELCSSICWESALIISCEEELKLAELLSNVLVGRFAFNRPPMKTVRKFSVSLKLRGACLAGLLDSNHIII